jgi:hypothetical protein
VIRKKMLKQLSKLPHPITVDLVVFDDGCDFHMLTPEKALYYLVYGKFPIHGPFKLSSAQITDFMRLISLKGDNSLDEALENYNCNEKRRAYLRDLLYWIGEDVIEEVVSQKWPTEERFYVFQNMASDEAPVIFSSLESAYARFLNYFTDETPKNCESESALWDSMSDEELANYYERLKQWRAKGSRKLPPRAWLGAYYSPLSGVCNSSCRV